MKHLWLGFLFVGLGFSGGVAAEKRATPSSPLGQRFLFIVDTSSSMDRLRTTTETAIHNLIAGGVSRQMTPGDTYGLWTFNKEVATDFPMQVWDSRNASQLGTIVAAYLSERTYERSANGKQLMGTLLSVIQSVSNLNVVLISDGSWAMTGTPFDVDINQHYKNRRKERVEAKAPFITTLTVRDGWIMNGSVKIAGERILFPEWPSPPAARLATGIRSNAPSRTAVLAANASPALSNAPPPSTESLVVSPPRKVMQIITRTNRPSPEPNMAATQSSEPARPGATSAIPTRVVESAAIAVAPAETNPAPFVPEYVAEPLPSGFKFVEAQPAPQPQASSQIPDTPLIAGLAALLPEPIPVAAREPATEPGSGTASLSPPIAVVPAPRFYHGPGMLLFGGMLMVAAILLTVVAFRRPRADRQGSFITQSMERR